MIETLKKQYALVQESRSILLNFVETQVDADIDTPVTAYTNKTIRGLMEHTTSCYFVWLAYFCLRQPYGSIKDKGSATFKELRQLYQKADETVATFLQNFDGKMEIPITAQHWDDEILTFTPLRLFTHVVTHEFHHKGQIVMICRMLGFVPPDTDI
ncbi:DinB family protein [Mucilaginibacter sp.]|uniref:DinB family protein n=1 Tax=Mucilaginibacter sp. TaxID=1882438 RepID=UPI0025D58B35|nr:DinB family protein [Mucilaginibacter sp.]